MNYELTVVLPEKATEAKKKSFTESLEKTIKIFKGKITEKADWGRIELAYPIKEEVAGNFLYFELEMEEDKMKDLGMKLKLDENLIRHLLVKSQEKDKKKPTKSR